MKKFSLGFGAAAALLGVAACKSHLFFTETSHFGLRAKVSADNPSPYDIDLGYRRGMLVAIPIKSSGTPLPTASSPAVSINVASGTQTPAVIIKDDPNELMSLYSTFRANIGFGDDTAVQHFLATGKAAVLLISNHGELRKLDRIVGASRVPNPASPTPTPPPTPTPTP